MARPEKRKKVQAFLEGKLKFDSNPDGKHESFSIPKTLAIHLPNRLPINLQHGRGDVVAHIIRQIHQFLGLEYKEFVVGKDCNICASVIYRALLWKHLDDYVTLYLGNRSAYGAILEQYLISSKASLKVIETEFGIDKLNKHESQLASRIKSQSEGFKSRAPDYSDLFDGKLEAFVSQLLQSFVND